MFTPRGIRNLNFGNIEDGPFAQGLPGYAGTDGRFAKFDSPDNGLNAIDTLLAGYGKRGINNVSGVVQRWAPSSDGNNTGAYSDYVSKKLGVGPNDPIDLSDPSVRSVLARGIAEHENGPQAFNAAYGQGAPTASAEPASYTAPAPRGPANFSAPPQAAQSGTATILPPKRGSGPGEYSFDNFKSNAPDAFMGAGAALASISSPAQGAALAQLAAQNNKDGFSMHIDPNTGAVLRINTKNGQVDRVGGSTPKLTETALKHVADNAEKYSTIQSISENAADLRKMISDGTLDLGAFNNWMNTGRNMAGLSNDQSRAYAKWEAFRQQLANDQLLQAKGVQTEGDAYRAMRQFSAGAAGYDNKAATQSLDTLIDRNRQAVTGRGGALIDSYSTMYGAHPAFKPYTDQLDSAKRFYDTIAEQRKAEAEKLRAPPLTANPGARDTLKAKYGLK
jgi:hypothetical protein